MSLDSYRPSWVRETPLPSLTLSAVTTNAVTAVGGSYGNARTVIAQLNTTAISGSGGTLTVFVEDSVDGGTNWNTLITFTAVTAVGVQRQAVSTPFGNQLRIRYSLAGTTPNATFQIDWVVKSA